MINRFEEYHYFNTNTRMLQSSSSNYGGIDTKKGSNNPRLSLIKTSQGQEKVLPSNFYKLKQEN
jgi:hypothetical protein